MHINIISRSLRSGASVGPAKVLRNTIRGLELIGVHVSLNGDIVEFDSNWIHDDLRAYAHAVAIEKPILFGPNLVANPEELPFCWRKPANGSIYFYAGENYQFQGELDSALILWKKAYDVQAISPLAIVSLGKSQWISGDEIGAKAQFATALKLTKNKLQKELQRELQIGLKKEHLNKLKTVSQNKKHLSGKKYSMKKNKKH